MKLIELINNSDRFWLFRCAHETSMNSETELQRSSGYISLTFVQSARPHADIYHKRATRQALSYRGNEWWGSAQRSPASQTSTAMERWSWTGANQRTQPAQKSNKNAQKQETHLYSPQRELAKPYHTQPPSPMSHLPCVLAAKLNGVPSTHTSRSLMEMLISSRLMGDRSIL